MTLRDKPSLARCDLRHLKRVQGRVRSPQASVTKPSNSPIPNIALVSVHQPGAVLEVGPIFAIVPAEHQGTFCLVVAHNKRQLVRALALSQFCCVESVSADRRAGGVPNAGHPAWPLHRAKEESGIVSGSVARQLVQGEPVFAKAEGRVCLGGLQLTKGTHLLKIHPVLGPLHVRQGETCGHQCVRLPSPALPIGACASSLAYALPTTALRVKLEWTFAHMATFTGVAIARLARHTRSIDHRDRMQVLVFALAGDFKPLGNPFVVALVGAFPSGLLEQASAIALWRGYGASWSRNFLCEGAEGGR